MSAFFKLIKGKLFACGLLNALRTLLIDTGYGRKANDVEVFTLAKLIKYVVHYSWHPFDQPFATPFNAI